jgi:mono/diheme cytochrome c family protein
VRKAKIALGLVAVVVAGVLALVSWLVFSGPRMDVQPSIGTYEAIMPVMPAGSVPVTQVPGAPSEEVAATLTNPVAATPGNIKRGRVYYSYYCAFCHGDAGDGAAPVGRSYMPAPTDLQSDKVQGYSDGEMLRKMLTGTGHEPVLERVVPPEHRWYIVLFVKNIRSAKLDTSQPVQATPAGTP